MKRFLILCTALVLGTPATAQAPVTLWRTFVDPPTEARPMVRWWWFGPAVTEAEIDREIAAMKAGGFGGFEVQPTYPLSPDDPPRIVNQPYMSAPFLAALRHAGETARASRMRIDVTIGSGWPFGGPHIPIGQAAAEVRMVRVAVGAKLPALGSGETLLAVFAGGKQVDASSTADRIAYVAGRTGQQVKRPAIGSEGFVLDHMSRGAVANHLATIGDPLLTAFPRNAPPYAMFSDSLEAYGSSWTDDLPAEFRRRRGYDLIAHLPALFGGAGAEAAAVRYDWARTMAELVDENYLAPIDAWARARGTRFRSQTYGIPPVTLSSNALVALPEGEGSDWRSFTSTRWATSAAHLYGRAVVSSETWTWLHAPSFAATPLDMKAEADRHFLQGVTQLIGHGWPYSPPDVAEPGWAFYAAAALNDHNPWYPAMPDVTRYLARVSALLRAGQPANGVALYVPTEDAFAAMDPKHASVNEAMRERLPRSLVGRILDAGHGFDLIDAGAIRARGIRHRLLVLPSMQRIDPVAYRAIADWVGKGGRVISVGSAPEIGGGLLDGAAASRDVAAITRKLGLRVVTEDALTAAIVAHVPPDMAFDTPDPAVGFIRRALPKGDLYFVANTGNRPITTTARFAGDMGDGQWWDAATGARWAAGTGRIALRLAPYESRILVFGAGPAPARAEPRAVADLSSGWSLRFPAGPAQPASPLRWWSDQSYSGSAVYSRSFEATNTRLLIDFGTGMPQTGAPSRQGMKALFDPPVREAAIVTVNGVRAGTLWTPPYRLDISRLVRPGTNRIEVTVMNSALNRLAAGPLPDYRLLSARYGERFQMQGLDLLKPAPSGLIGPITLMETLP